MNPPLVFRVSGAHAVRKFQCNGQLHPGEHRRSPKHAVTARRGFLDLVRCLVWVLPPLSNKSRKLAQFGLGRFGARNCSGRSGSWRRWPFTDRYLRLTTGVKIQTAVAIMAAQSTVHIYISATAKKWKNHWLLCSHHAETQIRQGVEAWSQLQDRLRELAALNKERLIPSWIPKARSAFGRAATALVQRGNEAGLCLDFFLCYPSWIASLSLALVKSFKRLGRQTNRSLPVAIRTRRSVRRRPR